MHQLVPLKTKVGIVVALAAVLSGLSGALGLHFLSMSFLVAFIYWVVLYLLLHSWNWVALLPAVLRPAWSKVILNGTWSGKITSEYRGSGGASAPPISARLTIRQTWQEVVFSLETAEMRSRSSGAVPFYDAVTNELQFRYFFETEPRPAASAHNPPQRLGTAVARIKFDAPDCLTITYSNERGPGGEISLRRDAGRERHRILPARALRRRYPVD
jgi:hypothetical protein